MDWNLFYPVMMQVGLSGWSAHLVIPLGAVTAQVTPQLLGVIAKHRPELNCRDFSKEYLAFWGRQVVVSVMLALCEENLILFLLCFYLPVQPGLLLIIGFCIISGFTHSLTHGVVSALLVYVFIFLMDHWKIILLFFY